MDNVSFVGPHYAQPSDTIAELIRGDAASSSGPTEVEIVATEPAKQQASASKGATAKQKKTSAETLSEGEKQPVGSSQPTSTTGNAVPGSADGNANAGAGGSRQPEKGVPKPRPMVKLTEAAGPALVACIQRLEGAERQKRVREVNALTKFELERENNIAVTKEMARRLKEGVPFAHLAAELGIAVPEAPFAFNVNSEVVTSAENSDQQLTVATPSHRSSPIPTSPTSPAVDEVNPNDDNNAPRTSMVESDEQNSDEITPVPIDLNRDGWPNWLEDHHGRFTAVGVPPQVEVVWQELLGFWPMLERAMGFASPVCNIQLIGRLSDGSL